MKKSVIVYSISLLAGASVYAGTVVVSPGNMKGWSFWSMTGSYNSPQPGAVTQMVTGPATPPLGTGSAELSTAVGGADGAAGITTGAFDGTLLSSITSLSYAAYDTVNNGQQFPYLAINVNLNVNGQAGAGGQDTLFFEPTYQTPGSGNPSLPNQGAEVQNQWQVWNAAVGGFWDSNGNFNPGTTEGDASGVNSLAAFDALFPYATIADSAAPSFGIIDGITLQVGFESPGDTETGYVDDVTIGTGAGTTTYDFEPRSVPDNSGTLVLSLITLAAFAGFGVFAKKRCMAV